MNQLFIGDALTVLKSMEAQSVHCCICSPPYWGLRQYLEGIVVLRPDLTEQELLYVFEELVKAGVKPCQP